MSKYYSNAGVNLEAGYESVERIKKHIQRTVVKGALNSLGAFGGMFDLSAYNLKEPVLVSGTDGVGTKLMLAFMADKHDTIGIDAVAMCVNDVIVQGAAPLFFLDYIAVGKNNPQQIEAIVKGIADGCVQAECSLIGGETAEMPDMYANNHYDIAGFCVGAVEKQKLVTGKNIKAGDVIIGLPSSGLHSNGFSLVRKILFKDNNIPLSEYLSESQDSLKNVLLTPTYIYVKAIKALLEKVNITAMAHITGGGFYENLPRMLPHQELQIVVEKKAIPIPPIFTYLQHLSKISNQEMYNIFNMGLGFAIVIDKKEVSTAMETLNQNIFKPFIIGEIKNKQHSSQETVVLL